MAVPAVDGVCYGGVESAPTACGNSPRLKPAGASSPLWQAGWVSSTKNSMYLNQRRLGFRDVALITRQQSLNSPALSLLYIGFEIGGGRDGNDEFETESC